MVAYPDRTAFFEDYFRLVYLASNESETFILTFSDLYLGFAVRGDAPVTAISVRDSVFLSMSRK
jgi:hypothetical protein